MSSIRRLPRFSQEIGLFSFCGFEPRGTGPACLAQWPIVPTQRLTAAHPSAVRTALQDPPEHNANHPGASSSMLTMPILIRQIQMPPFVLIC